MHSKDMSNRPQWFRLVAAGLLLFLALPPGTGQAQSLDSVAVATRTFAIENARIVQRPGRVINNGTVVFRNGIIEAVGRNVTVPSDAARIPGDSLTVYAGFIDGLSHTGIPAPKREANTSNEGVNRANPPNDRAGIQPERSAYEMLDASDKSIAQLRSKGFTTAHVVPHGLMLPGKGAIVLLAGENANQMVYKRDVSMFAQLSGARGVYPATPMGVMAKMRQLYREAARRQSVETLYATNQSGMPRPQYDAVHNALFPVVEGRLPVFMDTSQPLDIYRALRLQSTLGYPLVLSGLYGGFESVDMLLDADVPLFLNLKLPKEPDTLKKSKKEDEEKPTLPISGYDPSLHVTDHTSTETERINLQTRQKIFYNEYLATAATLYDAGLNFGFTTKGVKAADIHGNIKKMIDAGLTEDVALASLTTVPAEILGLSRVMGTVEKGKMANLVVTKGSVFAEKPMIKMVFVDGQKFEYQNDKNNADK